MPNTMAEQDVSIKTKARFGSHFQYRSTWRINAGRNRPVARSRSGDKNSRKSRVTFDRLREAEPVGRKKGIFMRAGHHRRKQIGEGRAQQKFFHSSDRCP